MNSFCYQQIGIDPQVLGYQILIKAPILDEKTDAGLYLPLSHLEEQNRRQNIGQILAMGPSAFVDRCLDRKCEIGDWVAYSNFERNPEFVGDYRLFYINDAHILARYTEEDVRKILKRGK
jgi:co-chaperonin GroES (HSP10)